MDAHTFLEYVAGPIIGITPTIMLVVLPIWIIFDKRQHGWVRRLEQPVGITPAGRIVTATGQVDGETALFIEGED